MSKAIEFKQIKKVYGEKTVIEGFDLTVERGEFVTVIGSSGCGKTTVLKMVNGLVIPDGGSIFVEGRDISEMDMISLRRNIGYVIQGSVLFPHMTVEENISYVPDLRNKKAKERTKKAVEKWMGIVGLDEDMTHDISEALKLGTKVLVMDRGKIEQYAAPEDLLKAPSTEFVSRLVEKERRVCTLPDEQLADCGHSGAAGHLL